MKPQIFADMGRQLSAAYNATCSATHNPFTAAALAHEPLPPARVVRMVSLGICGIFAVALVFAFVARMDVVVSAPGKVIPSGKSKVVQPLETGVVRTIAVRDGQSVKAGDVLFELDMTMAAADLERQQRELLESEADVMRLTAQQAGQSVARFALQTPGPMVANQSALLQSRVAEYRARQATLQAEVSRRQAEMDATARTLEQLRRSLPLVQQKNQMYEELARTGHVARTALLESQLELINAQKEMAVQDSRLKESQAGLRAAQDQRAQARAEFQMRSQSELVEVTKRRDAAQQELVKARQRMSLQTLRSPIDGVVQQLAVTTVGGVVTPAQPLLTVVPEHSALEVEAQALNRDVGHLKVGQRVINKIETYDFTRYGYIEGEVLWVGTDAVQDPRLGPVYPVRIRLHDTQTPRAVNGRKGVVSAGMTVTADVLTDQRRLVDYVLAPLLRYRQEALRER